MWRWFERIQRNEHEAGIGLAPAGKPDGGLDRGILLEDADELRQLLLHQLKRNALVGLDDADDPAGILLREEALRNDVVQVEIETEHGGEDQHHRCGMPQRRGQRPAVEVQHPFEKTLACPIEPPMASAGLAAQQHRAHHRRGRERNRQRNHDRDRDRHREFAKQPADDAAHQQDRNEHRDQRDTHRKHGEADLVGALERGFQRRHPLFDIAGDVLQHDDGVVDHEAGRHRKRHQRQIVEAVANQVHHREGRDQRHRHRDHRHQRGAEVSQEGEYHEDHQQHRKDQGSFDVVQRGANGGRAIDRQCDVDGRRDRGFQLRHQRFHRVDGADDVGAGLPVEDDQHRRLAVGKAGVTQVFHPVGDLADIGKVHRRAVAVGDDQRSGSRQPCWPGRWHRSGSADRRHRYRPSDCAHWRWPSAARTSSRPMPYL